MPGRAGRLVQGQFGAGGEPHPDALGPAARYESYFTTDDPQRIVTTFTRMSTETSELKRTGTS